MVRLSTVAAAAALVLFGSAAQASASLSSGYDPTVTNTLDFATGSFNGLSWEARSLIVGMTPTASQPSPALVGGGNSLFFPGSDKSGVVALIMDYGAQGRFICTGSLLEDRNSILTAAHCVRPRGDVAVPTTTAFFFGGDADVRTPFNGESRVVTATVINPGYTGQVIDHNDIAVLKLGIDAPASAQSYQLYTTPDLRGLNFNVAGYGGRSSVGGGGATGGANATTGFLREGDNLFDYRMGDPIFSQIAGNGWQTVYPNNPNIAFSYLSDFDSGLAANDMACLVAQASNLAQAAGAVFCNTGRGDREVGVAGGDSGGPQFVDGKIASVTSYGLTFGTSFGDCRTGLQSSCGEFSGYVPIYIHTDFIMQAMAVPEPEAWALMAAGLGVVGWMARRRRAAQDTAKA